MEIRTSYFAQLRKIKAMDGAVPVAVCRYLPDWYKGAVYKKSCTFLCNGGWYEKCRYQGVF